MSVARIVSALAWLRVRVLVNSMRRMKARGDGEGLARVAEVLSWLLLLLVLLPITVGVAVASYHGGRLLAVTPQREILVLVRVVLIAQLGVLALTPFLRSPGSYGSASRLRLLPVPRGVLHASAMLAALGDPWIAALAPGLLILPVGLFAGGLPLPHAALALVACLLALALMLVVASTAELAVQLVVRDRRRGEIVLLAVMMAVMALGFLPLLLAHRIEEARAAEIARVGERSEVLPAWLDALPPGQFALAVERVATRRPASAVLPLLVLAGSVLVLGAASFALHARVLEEPERMAPGRRATLPKVRVAGALASPIATLALLQARAVTRTVWGRLAIFAPPVVVALIALLHREMARMGADIPFFPSQASRLFLAGAAMGLLNLQASVVNQFAIDRAGLTLQFLVPLTDEQIVRAKAACGAMLLGTCAAASLVVAVVVGERSDAAHWLAALLTVGSAWLVVAPLGAVLSAAFPRAVDPSRVVASSGPHVAASTIGTIVTLAALAVPTVAFVAGSLAGGPLAGVAVVAAWTGILVIASPRLLRMSAEVLGARRESLTLALRPR